jgi:hypothetical protein
LAYIVYFARAVTGTGEAGGIVGAGVKVSVGSGVKVKVEDGSRTGEEIDVSVAGAGWNGVAVEVEFGSMVTRIGFAGGSAGSVDEQAKVSRTKIKTQRTQRKARD